MTEAGRQGRRDWVRRAARVVVPAFLLLVGLGTANLTLMFAWLTATPGDDEVFRRRVACYSFCGATVVCWVLAGLCVYWLRPRAR